MLLRDLDQVEVGEPQKFSDDGLGGLPPDDLFRLCRILGDTSAPAALWPALVRQCLSPGGSLFPIPLEPS